MTEPFMLPIDDELVHLVVREWLKRHLGYSQDTHATSKYEDDVQNAAADILAFKRILEYMGEGE